jgi:rhamnosyltransferase
MKQSASPTIGVVVPTWQGRHHLTHCLSPLLLSPLKPRVLVIDSSSTDGTASLARSLGAETIEIPQKQFNHGTTRELGRRHLATDIVLMVTQDCYAEDRHVIGKLVSPLLEGKASISYARQRPHRKASFFESFPRDFNYPAPGHIRGLEDIDKHGVYTFFCSNSFAAYTNSALDEIGGFSSVLLGEDTVATARLLRKGHRIAYVAEAIVHHSHRYTLLQEFRRSFDTGFARRSYEGLLEAPKGDGHRGRAYALELGRRLCLENPALLPYVAVQIALKWLGYHVGRRGENLPNWLKRSLSSHKSFWEN